MSSATISTIPSQQRWLAADLSAALIQTAQHGTARDLEVLLQTIRPVLFAYFARRVDTAAADDLAQQALLIIAREYRRVTPEGAARWLVTVARNVVRDEFRRRARAATRRAHAHDAQSVPAPEMTAARVEYADLAEAIVTAAQTTCTASLRAVILGIMRGLDVPEIARELGVSEPAVRVRLTRARVLLRPALRAFW
jgi:RNA polymerase sigma-70 factor, ECF subfamily